jgi:hypothetical protein
MAARALPQALEAAELWHSWRRRTKRPSSRIRRCWLPTAITSRHGPLLERQIAQSANPIETLDRLQRVLAHSPEPAQGYAVLEQVAQRYVHRDPATAFDAH